MIILLLTAFLVLSSYTIYAVKDGVTPSLSASYYVVKKPYLFQIALGVTGLLMTVLLVELTEGKWFQFLSFLATAALIFVAFSPNYKTLMEGKVHAAGAYMSALASVLMIVFMGYWWIPLITFSLAGLAIWRNGNMTFWLEMACFAAIFTMGALILF